MCDQSKLAVFHDYFAVRGGGERLVLSLANELEAQIFFGYQIAESYAAESFPSRSRSLGIPGFLRVRGLRPFVLALGFALRRSRASSFAARIFSGVAAPFAAPKRGAVGVNIFYCHTPPRFLFDQRRHFLAGLPPWLRVITPVSLTVFEWGYRRSVARMHIIVTNSENTRDRIHRYLGLESVIVTPPVDTDRFTWRGQDDYYLSTARLTPLKRVEQVVNAFLKMPEKRLVVASGGEQLDALKRKAAGAANIEFRGWVGDDELIELIGNAIATIYVPRDEDFGMSPVESMAAGKPVIGVAEGGLLETIVPNETGILLPPDFREGDLIDAVRQMTPERALAMRSACEARASLFTREKFMSAMREVIEDALRSARGRD